MELGKVILEELKGIKGILHEHTEKLDAHSKILAEHTEKLDAHSKILDEHTEKLNEHSETFKEHGRMLSALRTGQDELKAGLDGMRMENAKDFGAIKEQLGNVEASIEVLKDETWMNKKDIYRLKTTIGIK